MHQKQSLRTIYFRAAQTILAISLVAAAAPITQAAEPDTRADFLKIIDRPRVPLDPEVKELSAGGKFAEYHFTYAADANQRVAGILVKPMPAADAEKAEPRRPVVIALHGTGGKKTDELPLLRELAAKGFIGVAIDGRYHGERSAEGKGSTEYQDAIARRFQRAGRAARTSVLFRHRVGCHAAGGLLGDAQRCR